MLADANPPQQSKNNGRGSRVLWTIKNYKI